MCIILNKLFVCWKAGTTIEFKKKNYLEELHCVREHPHKLQRSVQLKMNLETILMFP